MDDTAEKMLRELGGTGGDRRKAPGQAPNSAGAGTGLKGKDHLDQWHTHLVDLAYLFNATFRDAHYWEGVRTEKDTFRQFVDVLGELDKLPGHNGVVRIHHRGRASAKVDEKIDYLIEFGKVSLDLQAISGIVKRVGIRVKHLEGRLSQTFETLAKQGIQTIDLRLPGPDRKARNQLKTALQIVASFNHAVENETSIAFKKDGKPHSLEPVLNDDGQPDPNLTVMAALNDLGPGTTRDLVGKILALRKNPQFAGSGLTGLSVYKTIFAIKALREKLVRPPVEVNVDRTPASGKNSSAAGGGHPGGAGRDAGGGRAGGPAQPIVADAVRKAEIATYVKQAYGASPAAAARVMESIYSADYETLDSHSIGDRLATLTNLLARLEESKKGQKVMDTISQQIQAGFDKVPDEMLDDLIVEDNEVKLWDGEAVQSVARVDDQLAGIIENTKSRSAAKRQMQPAVGWEKGFAEEDYDRLATHHGITREEAEKICQLFEKCFDRNGNFQRAAFEEQVPAFAQYPEKVFEILWEFLKATSRRSDRLPLMNSFQLLNERIQEPIKIIRFLLVDFSGDPSVVSFPDRNAMMLAIQFLRTHNNERHMDIEITPEEVLQVKSGLDQQVAHYASWTVDGNQEKTIAKIVTIRKRLLEALQSESQSAQGMAFRFLLALEREVHIFLALCGGKTATTVIRGGLNVYGNPESAVYKSEGGRTHLAALMQHLAVLIRSIARLGTPADLAVLTEIKKRQRGFAQLDGTPRHQALVRRVIGGSDAAIRKIQARKAPA